MSKKEQARAVEQARQQNALHQRAGQVRLGLQVHFRNSAATTKRWRVLHGFRNVSVAAGAKKWKALSPNSLGPVAANSVATNGAAANGAAANSLECLWRFSIVEPDELVHGRPTDAWFAWRARGFALPRGKPIPRAMRKPISADTLFWWDEQTLDLVSARKRILCVLYAQLASTSSEYIELNQLVQSGYNIQLFGYTASRVDEADAPSLHELLHDPNSLFGHEHILYGMLTRQRVWE